MADKGFVSGDEFQTGLPRNAKELLEDITSSDPTTPRLPRKCCQPIHQVKSAWVGDKLNNGPARIASRIVVLGDDEYLVQVTRL